jgi:hypothetical protein
VDEDDRDVGRARVSSASDFITGDMSSLLSSRTPGTSRRRLSITMSFRAGDVDELGDLLLLVRHPEGEPVGDVERVRLEAGGAPAAGPSAGPHLAVDVERFRGRDAQPADPAAAAVHNGLAERHQPGFMLECFPTTRSRRGGRRSG